MTDVNVAELRCALEAPDLQWTSTTPGLPVVPTATFVIVNRATLAALLDAYESEGAVQHQRTSERLAADLEEAEAEICRLVEDDPVNGHGGWRRREFEGRSSGDYSKWPAIARALKKGAPDPAEEWTPVPEQVDLTKMPGYSMGYEAGFGERSKIPATWTRIIESILARVLAGEPAAQVVADYADEHGGTIQGLEWVEKLVKAADIRRAHTEGVMRLKEAADKRAGALEAALQELLVGVELTPWRHGPQRLRQAYSDARALLEAPKDA